MKPGKTAIEHAIWWLGYIPQAKKEGLSWSREVEAICLAYIELYNTTWRCPECGNEGGMEALETIND
jgi:hypothetical protein